MRDIFLCPNGNMLKNWTDAFPEASVATSIRGLSLSYPVVFWVHANANDIAWLQKTMTEVKQKFEASKIVILANTPNQQDAFSVMSAGAVGYCHAYSAAAMLIELKTVVMHGGVWLGNDLLQSLINATKPVVHNASASVKKAFGLLTKREVEVAKEAAKGLSNKEIARLLTITERTVKAHISAILEKLGVKDRLQLALVLNEKEGDSKKNTRRVRPARSKKGAKKKKVDSQYFAIDSSANKESVHPPQL